jgi:ribonuclease VapC
MVLDSSAIIAILLREADSELLEKKADRAQTLLVGSPTVFESIMVLSGRLARDARIIVTDLLWEMDAQVIPFTEDHVEAAVDAFLRFGKGRHPAGLNFGDCMSYAVASLARMPLLYIGTDFSKTDVLSA